MLATITLLLLQQAGPACPAQAQACPTAASTVRTVQIQSCPATQSECATAASSQEPGAQAVVFEGQNCDLAELERCIAQIECTGTEIERCLAELELQCVLQQEGQQPQQGQERRVIMIGPDGQQHEMNLDLAMPVSQMRVRQESGPVCSRCAGQMDEPRREVIRLRAQSPQAHAGPRASAPAHATLPAQDRLGALEQRMNDLDARLARMEELLLQIAAR